MKIKNRKSQGSLLVTVLLVVIGIAAVVIIGGFVMNFMKENLQTPQNVDISIDREYPPSYSASNQRVIFTVQRGSDDANLTGIKIIIVSNGASASSENYIVPGVYERNTYVSDVFPNKPDYIEIAPIIQVGNENKVLAVADKCDITEFFRSVTMSELNTISGSSGFDLPPEPGNPPAI